MVRRRGSAMVPLDRALVSSYRLSIVTMSLSGAVWPQFAMQSAMFVETLCYLFTLLIPEVVRSGLILTGQIVTKLANISGLTVPN